MTKMNFIFRRPRFPVILDTGNGLIAARSWAILERRLAKITFPDKDPRNVIDAAAEQFSLHPETLLFAPSLSRKPWSKATIIALYNSNKAPGQADYPTTSLGNKSLDKVANDIVDLLIAA